MEKNIFSNPNLEGLQAMSGNCLVGTGQIAFLFDILKKDMWTFPN